MPCGVCGAAMLLCVSVLVLRRSHALRVSPMSQCTLCIICWHKHHTIAAHITDHNMQQAESVLFSSATELVCSVCAMFACLKHLNGAFVCCCVRTYV